METNELIAADELCMKHHIEFSFIRSMQESGLIEITVMEQHHFVPARQLPRLEQLIRLHYDLDINVEGIEAVAHLLEKVHTMQQEIKLLRNKLRLYENE